MPNEKPIHVNLTKFRCRDAVKRKFNALLVGKRNTGKSVLMADILYYLNKEEIPRACVFSATEEVNRFFCKYIPDSYIFDDSDLENQLDIIIRKQQALFMQRELGQIPGDTDLRIVIVLDDIGYNKKALSSKALKFLFMNGRHYDIIVLLAVQHVMQIKPELRSNCDYVICLSESNKNVVKNLYDNFFGIFERPAHFKNAFDACTQNYGCLVLNNLERSHDVDLVVNWYKATPGRKFKFGSDEFWENHETKYVSPQQRFLMESNEEHDDGKTTSRDGMFTVRKQK